MRVLPFLLFLGACEELGAVATTTDFRHGVDRYRCADGGAEFYVPADAVWSMTRVAAGRHSPVAEWEMRNDTVSVRCTDTYTIEVRWIMPR